MRSRRRLRRLLLAALVACTPVLATMALAQTKPKAAKPKPAPAAKVDAQAPAPEETNGGANAEAANDCGAVKTTPSSSETVSRLIFARSPSVWRATEMRD